MHRDEPVQEAIGIECREGDHPGRSLFCLRMEHSEGEEYRICEWEHPR